MIIALTGATGRIGRQLLSSLKNNGHEVISISSSMFSDQSVNFSYEELFLDKINISVDLFIHLASINSKLKHTQIQDEVKLSRDVLKSLKFLKCTRFIFFSSCKVYGSRNQIQSNFNEDNILDPECAYGKAKRLCEIAIKDFAQKNAIDTLILRLPPLIDQSKNSNVGKLLSYANSNLPLVSFRNVKNKRRSYISFENISIVMLKICTDLRLINNSTYNLADSYPLSIGELLIMYRSRQTRKDSELWILPSWVFYFLKYLPLIRNLILRIFQNIVIENKKLINDMDVKLLSTKKALERDS